ncbi:hypothetical protein WJX82_001962 [Trebouxia sp. C0006]
MYLRACRTLSYKYERVFTSYRVSVVGGSHCRDENGQGYWLLRLKQRPALPRVQLAWFPEALVLQWAKNVNPNLVVDVLH